MNRADLVKALVHAEVEVVEEVTEEEKDAFFGDVEKTNYSLEYVPRRYEVENDATVLFNSTVGNPGMDNGAYSQTLVARLSETEAALFELWYPEYCDDEADGHGNVFVHEWDEARAKQGMDALVEQCRTETVRSYLTPVINNREQLFGINGWCEKLVQALVSNIDPRDRIGVLRSMADAANSMVVQEAWRRLYEMAPRLASMELEYDSEYDDQGGSYLYLVRTTMNSITNETEAFGGEEDMIEACDDDLIDRFQDKAADELDSEFDPDGPEHRAAFGRWVGEKFGVTDWEEFWSILWAWIDTDKSQNTVTFRAVEGQS